MVRVITTRLADPRYYQVAVLSSLLVYGVAAFDFGVTWLSAAVIVTTALATQWAAGRLVGLPRFDPLSALITSLSLTLLLRTDSLVIAGLAAVLAISSKFVIRIDGKHVFNPANLAIVTLMLATDHAWLSSGQWGSATLLAFGFACAGLLVLTKARRAETTVAFLVTFAGLLFARSMWLGDPLTIPLHQLKSGALLLFAFFMISDPKTTPDHALGRMLYGALVAVAGYGIQFVLYEPHGPITALVFLAPFVPVIDRLFTGRRYAWTKPQPERTSFHKGVVT